MIKYYVQLDTYEIVVLYRLIIHELKIIRSLDIVSRFLKLIS